jgi:hypothetical protein
MTSIRDDSAAFTFTVREARFRVEQPGFRTRSVVVVTTLLDPEQPSKGGGGET